MSPPIADTAGTVASVRAFNRFYTRQIGVLNEGLLDSPFSLTEVRVLFEIGHRSGPTATELAADLGLDAGYLSRMLQRLAKRRLVARDRATDDGRRRPLRLTSTGRSTLAGLDRSSSAQVARMIGGLPAGEEQRLAGLMHSIRHLLEPPAASGAEVKLRAPAPGDLGWVVQRHGAVYAREYGWDQTFEALVARIVGGFGEKHDPRRERCWIAERDGQPVGCVFLVRQSERVAKLRLLLVEPGARSLGVGRRLVEACVRFAREAGYRKVRLWTNSVLVAARRLYTKAGFRLVESAPHHSFGRDLVGETWELVLDRES